MDSQLLSTLPPHNSKGLAVLVLFALYLRIQDNTRHHDLIRYGYLPVGCLSVPG